MNWIFSQDSRCEHSKEVWDMWEWWDVSLSPLRSVTELATHSRECLHHFPLLWPGHVRHTWWHKVLGLYWSLWLRNPWPWEAKLTHHFMWEAAKKLLKSILLEDTFNLTLVSAGPLCWLAKDSYFLIKGIRLFLSHDCSHQVEASSILIGPLFLLPCKWDGRSLVKFLIF